MTDRTTKNPGLASLIRLVGLLCKVNGKYAGRIREKLTGNERIAYDALVLACDAFNALFPFQEGS